MLHTISAKIWVEIPDGADVEDVAHSMHRGLKSAIDHFPAAEVVKASVQTISVTPPEEIEEEGLGE